MDLVPKSSAKFCCKLCDYSTSRKSQYDRHLATDKHKMIVKLNNLVPKSSTANFVCVCGKTYKYDSGYYRHKKDCPIATTQTAIDVPDKELIMTLIKQNAELLGAVKQGTHGIYNNCNNTSNSHNKTFNLQFFLNETCKDAMNIMEFVDSIKLQLSDLESVGKLGYVEGISNIITKNLNALDVTQRPVHCTDKKREVLYIKDEDKWEKEDIDKKKLRKVIRKIASKNQMLLPEFKKAHPDCSQYHSNYSDQYNKIIVESMGGSGDNDTEKEDKIIKKISSVTTIEDMR